MASFAFTSTKWALKLASKLIKADARVHNANVIEPDMAIVFVVNHFTRLETLLLPYELNQATGLEVWSLAAAELFQGKIGQYLRTMGTVSTKDPDRDKVIVHSLLKGDHPWVIFPEGQMIKDKKVIDPAGTYAVYNKGVGRRAPHKGAAAVALVTEFYRHHIQCIFASPQQKGIAEVKERFGLDSVEPVLAKRTVIIPVNVTYFPIRSRENVVLRMAQTLAKGGLGARAIEELSVEGTFLSEDTDIDISLGEPIDICSYLNAPEYGEIMACGDDLSKLEADPRSLFHDAADQLMHRYMHDIYRMTRVNYDHIFATLIRHQGTRPFTERRYRNRIYLCAHEIRKTGRYQMHDLLRNTYRDVVFEDPSPKFHDFLNIAIKEGVLTKDGEHYIATPERSHDESDFHDVRTSETTWVIANEVEPLEGFDDLVREVAVMPRKDLSRRVRKVFYEEDFRIFDEDYQAYRNDESHPMEVGRPFLICPERPKAGIVLVHGYLAAPAEVRALADHLYDHGYAVYGVRLRGHGTAPEDLAQTPWEQWYTSFNRGYVVIKSLTDRIILGGFSTGGCMALMGAGLKGDKIQAVFSINAPRELRQYTAKLASTVVSMSNLMKKMHVIKGGWDFVENHPENPHINYRRNPLAGIAQLERAMAATDQHLPKIVAPALVVQASKDPIVHPSSGPDIFERIGTPHKELIIMERSRHGIVNGDGAADVFDRVTTFLDWARKKAPRTYSKSEAVDGEFTTGPAEIGVLESA